MALEVEIQKRFEKFRLDVSFTAERGVTGLLGASGCGKSMTLKCIAGIVTPDAGRIVLDGRVLYDSEQRVDLPPQKRRVGYLFQHYALFPNMTAAGNIAAGAADRKTRRTRTAELVRALRLEGLEDKYPRQLSGGQQQRVALARILASGPEALLLDEPFSALDSFLKGEVEAELRDMLNDFPGPALLVTHSREEVRRLCARVCVLDHGRSEPETTVEALLTRPETLAACRLAGCPNLSRARPLPDGGVEALDWGAVLRPARPLPEGLTHVGAPAHLLRWAEGPGLNTLDCRVERSLPGPFSTAVDLKRGSAHLRAELPNQAVGELAAGDQVWLYIAPEDILLLR